MCNSLVIYTQFTRIHAQTYTEASPSSTSETVILVLRPFKCPSKCPKINYKCFSINSKGHKRNFLVRSGRRGSNKCTSSLVYCTFINIQTCVNRKLFFLISQISLLRPCQQRDRSKHVSNINLRNADRVYPKKK